MSVRSDRVPATAACASFIVRCAEMASDSLSNTFKTFQTHPPPLRNSVRNATRHPLGGMGIVFAYVRLAHHCQESYFLKPQLISRLAMLSAHACSLMRADIVRLLSTPRERQGSPRAQWLQNWQLASDDNLAEAQKLAEAAALRCTDGGPGGDDGAPPPLATLPNVRLYLAPCFSQCAHLPAAARRRCACRACAAATSWPAMGRICAAGHALRPYLDNGWCEQVRQLATEHCGGAAGAHVQDRSAAHDGGGQAQHHHHEHEHEHEHRSHGAQGDDGGDDDDDDGAPLSACRTGFNESCCPLALGARCGGPARGECVGSAAWLGRAARAAEAEAAREAEAAVAVAGADGGAAASTWPAAVRRCAWPLRHAAARCACRPRFGGAACGGCAEGWEGAGCATPRGVEVRRPLLSLPALEQARALAHRATPLARLRLSPTTPLARHASRPPRLSAARLVRGPPPPSPPSPHTPLFDAPVLSLSPFSPCRCSLPAHRRPPSYAPSAMRCTAATAATTTPRRRRSRRRTSTASPSRTTPRRCSSRTPPTSTRSWSWCAAGSPPPPHRYTTATLTTTPLPTA